MAADFDEKADSSRLYPFLFVGKIINKFSRAVKN